MNGVVVIQMGFQDFHFTKWPKILHSTPKVSWMCVRCIWGILSSSSSSSFFVVVVVLLLLLLLPAEMISPVLGIFGPTG